MKKWIFVLIPIFGFAWWSRPAHAFTFHQRRCLYAQRLPGKAGNMQRPFFVKVNCPYGVLGFVPQPVWQRDVDGYTTLLVKCYSNDCALTAQLIRKYAAMNHRLPRWENETR